MLYDVTVVKEQLELFRAYTSACVCMHMCVASHKIALRTLQSIHLCMCVCICVCWYIVVLRVKPLQKGKWHCPSIFSVPSQDWEWMGNGFAFSKGGVRQANYHLE